MRMAISGVDAFELDQLIELDLEVLHHDGATLPIASLQYCGDLSPGPWHRSSGLGRRDYHGSAGRPSGEIGQKVAAALVGTFLGILLCYGVVGPLASRLEGLSDAHAQFLQVLRIAIVAFARGSSPILAIEYARRSIPAEVRPSFIEMETSLRRDAKIPALPKMDGSGNREGEDAAVRTA